MREGRPSDTAMFVAMGRALAHANASARGFSDPFALQLLPDHLRAVVERLVRGERPRTLREVMLRLGARGAARLMGPRTVEIDDGLRAMASGHQLVIVGAGLDARAYRMRELSESVAFEVDHPASQAFKQERSVGLQPCTRELRRVSADLTHENLSDVLARAGHVASVRTAWVFEGVVSYLTVPQVEATLDAIAERSAPGSRLLATYNEPNRARHLVSKVFARGGEPHHASFTRERMHRLLERRGFSVVSDRDGLGRAQRWKPAATLADRFWLRLHHVVIADRVPAGRAGEGRATQS